MADTHKLDEALLRFDAALRRVEVAVFKRIDAHKRVAELEGEAESLRRDKAAREAAGADEPEADTNDEAPAVPAKGKGRRSTKE